MTIEVNLHPTDCKPLADLIKKLSKNLAEREKQLKKDRQELDNLCAIYLELTKPFWGEK